MLVSAEGMEVGGVLRKSNGARSDHQGGLDQSLPDEEEGHQTSPFLGAVGFAQKNITATGARKSGSQLGPDEAVQ